MSSTTTTTGFLGKEKVGVPLQSEVDCVRKKLEQSNKETSLVAYSGAEAVRALNPGVNSVYCTKSVVNPTTISIDE